MSVMLLSFTEISPFITFQKRIISFRSVDFPLPLFPTIPITLFTGTVRLIFCKIVSPPYENETLLTETLPNSVCSQPVISATDGFSSRISSTRLPAANVFCNVLPRLASATDGPNDENSAIVVISTPSKPIVPLLYSATPQKSMAKSKISIMLFVTAIFLPVIRFILASSQDRLSVKLFIFSRRFLPAPY